jgi:hypothetical protein
MLVSFSLDPDALQCAGEDLSVSVAVHRRVINEWRKHGVLVHSPGALKESALLKAVEGLPQESRKLWKTAFRYSRRRPATVDWDGSFPNQSLDEMSHLASEFMLALLETTRSVVVGKLGENESSRVEPSLADMELCKVHAVSESNCYQLADALSLKSLHAGDHCGREWAERYSSHLKQADHVAVVDRYILANHEWRRRDGKASGLNRLLNDCFKRPRDRAVNIKVMCAVQNEGDPLSYDENQQVQDFLQDLANQYCGGGIRSLDCYVLTDDKFRKFCHTRYFRTDYVVFGIDGGLDILGGATADRGCVFWRNDTAKDPYFSTQEAALQMNAFLVKKVV